MVSALDDAKRVAIAMQLAEMRSLQNLLIRNNQRFIEAVNDDHIRQRLQDMLEQDQKNLGVLDTVIIQYGVQGEPKESFKQSLEEIQKLMEDSQLTLSEKVAQHELLKHQQTMAGLIIHKAAQVVGADVGAAITPLNTINFENRAHQEQLKGILEVLGVRELTGQEPDRRLWARVEDSVAALTGVAGSVITRTDDEMTIRDLLLMDHSKADILFAEILGSDDPLKIQEYFGQLYQDVRIHGLAEEEVLYPAVRPYYDQMQEIVDQTDHVIEMLEEMKALNPSNLNFKAQIEQLRLATRAHVDQEEADIFPKLRTNFSHEQQKQLATQFKAAKSKLQKQQQEQSDPSQFQIDQIRNSNVISNATSNASNNRTKSRFIYIRNSIPWKLVFQSKAVINWVEAVLLLLGDRWIREVLQTEPLVNFAYSQIVYILFFIIGIGYWWVGQDISKNQAIVKLGIYIQFSVFAVLAYHTLIGNLHLFYLISGVIDLIFAILFSLFLYFKHENTENI